MEAGARRVERRRGGELRFFWFSFLTETEEKSEGGMTSFSFTTRQQQFSKRSSYLLSPFLVPPKMMRAIFFFVACLLVAVAQVKASASKGELERRGFLHLLMQFKATAIAVAKTACAVYTSKNASLPGASYSPFAPPPCAFSPIDERSMIFCDSLEAKGGTDRSTGANAARSLDRRHWKLFSRC